jgi:hypothetical protein
MRNGIINPYDGELTFLGRVLGDMPCDIRIGKLLVLGHVFGVLEEAIVIGSFRNTCMIAILRWMVVLTDSKTTYQNFALFYILHITRLANDFSTETAI